MPIFAGLACTNALAPLAIACASGNSRLRALAAAHRSRFAFVRPEALAVDEVSGALLAFPLSILDEDAPTREHDARHSDDLHAFIEVVVGAVVGGLRLDGVLRFGVPDDDIRVAAGRDDALARVDAEELGGVGAAQLDPAVEGEASATHALGVEDHHAVFDAGDAVGDLREIAFAQLFAGGPAIGAALKPEIAVVGRDDLKVVGAD